MQKRIIGSTIVFMTFALVGIIVVQILWIRNAINENEKQFDINVQTILNRIVNRYNRQESIMTFSTNIQLQQNYSLTNSAYDSIMFYIDSLKTVRNKINTQKKLDSQAAKQYVNLNYSIKRLEEMATMQQYQMGLVNEWFSFEYQIRQIPLVERLIISNLNGIIKHEFALNNFDMPYEYAVINQPNNTMVYGSKNMKVKDKNVYKIDLYPKAITGSSPILTIRFPEKQKLVIHSLRWLLIISIVFIIIIISAFYKTILLIMGQKKIADVKNDFINNMTHEFKTPIATINLATDALNSVMKSHHVPDNAFTSIIKQESSRMHRHIERILQIALFERDKIILNNEAVDIVPLVENVVNSFELRVSEFSGQLHLHKNADKLCCLIDQDHFTNVIYNLLDNAVKYNNKQPEISITLAGNNNFSTISVQDNGLGMTKEAIKKIFDKFYRIQTGNTHNVKGFGLGLSYVKLIVEKMRGTVQVKSRQGEGSEFIITLPLVTNN